MDKTQEPAELDELVKFDFRAPRYCMVLTQLGINLRVVNDRPCTYIYIIQWELPNQRTSDFLPTPH